MNTNKEEAIRWQKERVPACDDAAIESLGQLNQKKMQQTSHLYAFIKLSRLGRSERLSDISSYLGVQK